MRQVELKDFPKVLEEFSNLHVKQIREGVTSGIAKSIPDLVKASPVDTGLYAQSWSFTADEEKAVLGNYAPHSPIIEFGARKGFWPPIKPLLEWAKRVLQDPSQPPEYSPAVRSLAYGTRQKIHDEGILPKAVLQNALPQILENIREELRNVSG